MNVTIKQPADDTKTGVTLADLYQFIQNANNAGIDVRTPIKGIVGMRGQIKRIEVDG